MNKEALTNLANRYRAMAAATDAASVEEPGFEHKLKESYSGLEKDYQAAYGSEEHKAEEEKKRHEEEHDSGKHTGHEDEHKEYCAKCSEHLQRFAASTEPEKKEAAHEGPSASEEHKEHDSGREGGEFSARQWLESVRRNPFIYSNPYVHGDVGPTPDLPGATEESKEKSKAAPRQPEKGPNGALVHSYSPKFDATRLAMQAIQENAQMRGELALRDLRDFMASEQRAGRRFDAQSLEYLARSSADLYKGIETVRRMISGMPKVGNYAADPNAPAAAAPAQWAAKGTPQERDALGTVQYANRAPQGAQTNESTFAPGIYRDPSRGVDIEFTGDDVKDYETIGRLRAGGQRGALRFSAESLKQIPETNKLVDRLAELNGAR